MKQQNKSLKILLKLFSPAKLNLFLRILRKREDGYHELASLFQAIDFGDVIHFSASENDIFTCSVDHIPLDEKNLVIKARNLFRQKTQCKQKFTIHLDKNIPVEAGLGGGSSNAATVLWGLNELCQKIASPHQLIEWSKELGSDITFFLSQGIAYCTGRGEIFNSLKPLKDLYENCTIVKPSFGLSTPKVFQNLDTSLLKKRDPLQILNNFFKNDPEYFNDLEEVAFNLEPRLKIIKENLYSSGFKHVTMTGSGTTFFCFGEGAVAKEFFQKKVRFIHRKINSWYSL